MKPCIACHGENPTGLVLCPRCEKLAVMWREKDGLPIRKLPVLVARDEPDD